MLWAPLPLPAVAPNNVLGLTNASTASIAGPAPRRQRRRGHHCCCRPTTASAASGSFARAASSASKLSTARSARSASTRRNARPLLPSCGGRHECGRRRLPRAWTTRTGVTPWQALVEMRTARGRPARNFRSRRSLPSTPPPKKPGAGWLVGGAKAHDQRLTRTFPAAPTRMSEPLSASRRASSRTTRRKPTPTLSTRLTPRAIASQAVGERAQEAHSK